MENDRSKDIYEDFVRSKDKHVELTFQNNKIETGTFVGFFIGYENNNEPYITGWHFIPDEYWESYKFNSAYFGNGKIVSSYDIKEARFK